MDQAVFNKSAAVLADKVYQPAFLAGLNNCGIYPQTEKEAHDLMDMAIELRPFQQKLLQQKEAQERQSRFSGLLHKTAAEMRGISPTQAARYEQAQVYEKVAADFMQDPEVAGAAFNVQLGKAEAQNAGGA